MDTHLLVLDTFTSATLGVHTALNGGICKSMIAADVHFIRNRDVVSRQIEGELIIVPIRCGIGDLNSLYTLNPVGRVIWEFLTEGHTLPEMVQRVCDEFEVTARQAEKDITEFLDSLLEEKLIQSVA